MGHPEWRQIKEIFHEALEQDPGERAAFLDSACAGDRALRQEVESLLASDDDSFPWLDSPVFEAAAETLAGDEVVERTPTLKLGPYKIVHKLGQGGMGSVYLGERTDRQYERRVAIKIVRRDLADVEAIRRFRQERQILASLDHPFIAQLLDGGVTEEGLPYFIMEYIEGVPIDVYCDRQQLGLNARIDLFRKVCSAVQYAHRHLVVHCDLKPSNILVTEDGEPKLLDFGIARLLSTEYVPRAVTVTVDTDDHRLTPEYASPEQVHGERLTTASDVYSLGVLLYRVLTGTLPFHFRSKTMWEIERVICEEDPTKPSEVVNLRAPEGSPEKLRRMLYGDLDNIVLMAVRKDPVERYPSVEQLSEDLRRHCQGLPVLARRATVRYRAAKFIRRNRAWVTAAGLTAVSLVAGILATTWMAYEATTARREAYHEQVRANQVSEFLERLFKSADAKSEERARDLTVKELLDEAARKIEDELDDQPLVQVDLMNTIGVAFKNQARYDEAAQLLEGALKILRPAPRSQDFQLAETLGNLCSLRREQSDYAKALPFCRQALTLRRALSHDGSPKELVESLNQMALLMRDMGRLDEAETHYREALSLVRSHPGEDDVKIALTLHNLGGLLRIQGDFDDAERYLRDAVKLYREQLGKEHPYVAAGLNTLGTVFREKGDFKAAESAYREALDLRRKVDPEHPDVATTLNNLAALFYIQEDYGKAEPLFLQALDLFRQNDMGERREVMIILNHLGGLKSEVGDLTSAETYFSKALALGHRRFGKEHPSVTVSLLGLGETLTAQGRPGEAEGLLKEALRIRNVAYGEGHWRTANAMSHLGGCLTALGRFEEAESQLKEGYETLEKQRGAEYRATVEALERLIQLYDSWSKPAEAEALRSRLPS